MLYIKIKRISWNTAYLANKKSDDTSITFQHFKNISWFSFLVSFKPTIWISTQFRLKLLNEEFSISIAAILVHPSSYNSTLQGVLHCVMCSMLKIRLYWTDGKITVTLISIAPGFYVPYWNRYYFFNHFCHDFWPEVWSTTGKMSFEYVHALLEAASLLRT